MTIMLLSLHKFFSGLHVVWKMGVDTPVFSFGFFRYSSRLGKQITTKTSRLWSETTVDWTSCKDRPTRCLSQLRVQSFLFLQLIDMFLGIILCVLVLRHAHCISNLFNEFFATFHGFLRDWISWFMRWPAGLKLNDNLVRGLGTWSIRFIEVWSGFACVYIGPYTALYLELLSFSGVFGISLMLSFLYDWIAISMFHVFVLYAATKRLFDTQYYILSSLWKLFRGKKINPLRRRVDSCEYTINQLLLGTVIFTINFFLMPTVMVFYGFFLVLWTVICLIRQALDSCIHLLSHNFVLLVCMCLINKKLLPGGLYLTPAYVTQTTSTTYFHLQNKPISLPQFAQMFIY